jgi:hypothetical protein
MRLTIFTLFAILLLAITATAQVNFGIKAGANMAKITGDGWDTIEAFMDTPIDDKFKFGMAFGLMAEMPLGEGGFAIQPEVLYVMKGAKAEFPEAQAAGYDITMKVKQDYVEVPVLIKYNVPTEGSISPCLFAGPVVAFNAASKIEADNVPVELADEIPDGDIENNKSVDFGITFGGGVGMVVGETGRLTFDLRYTLGLTEVFDDVGMDEYEMDKIYMADDDGSALDFKNSDIRLMVGFFF